MRLALSVLTTLAALALAASYLGALHPIGDSLAVFRPVLAALLAAVALIALLLGARRAGLAGLAAGGLAAAPLAVSLAWGGAVPTQVDVTVYTKNLWAGLRDPAPLVADIRASGADVVLLQEVSATNRAILDLLRADYPHQHLCRFSGWGGIAILSRWPGSEAACSRSRTLAVMRLEAPTGPVWAASVHLAWPWPMPQQALLTEALPLLQQMQGAVVIGGDFNMVPWSNSLRRVAEASGAERLGQALGTRWTGPLNLPIDHLLSTGHGSVERRPALGSDHAGLVARIAL